MILSSKVYKSQFDYIEAHATGTPVGDPIEGNALATAFSSTERALPLRISSVKSNVGHMEAAAFHCALLKVVLMCDMLNNAIQFRLDHPEIEKRWVDVRYSDLVRDPMAVVHDIYSQLN